MTKLSVPTLPFKSSQVLKTQAAFIQSKNCKATYYYN